MASFNDIAKGIGIGTAALAAAGYFFPETTGYLTGGYVGTDAMAAGEYGPVNQPQFLGYNYPSFGAAAGMTQSGGTAAGAGDGLLSNPQFATAGLLTLTSLLGNMFGSDIEQEKFDFEKEKYQDAKDLSAEKLAQDKEMFEKEMAYKYEALKAAGGGAGAAAAAQKEIAAKNRRAQVLMQQIENNQQMALNRSQNAYRKPELVQRGRQSQVDAAQTTGAASGNFFNLLTQNLQRPLFR